jgi:uncharacterized RmlC-like cupin family protein
MMKRYIVDYDPKEITEDFLSGLDWDIIELPITVDTDKLLEWYNYVTTTYANLEFSFFNNPYIKEQHVPQSVKSLYGYSNRLHGPISSWGLDWPAETDLPIPPPFAAKEEFYPELSQGLPFKIQEKYNIMYFKTLIEALGSDAFKQSRITQHYAGAGILGHVDGNYRCLRVHIPIITHPKSKFLYGDKLERSYTLTAGKVYLINASVWHSTTNEDKTRSHIISDPTIEKVLKLVNTRIAV